MYFKCIFSYLTLSLFALTSVNGYIINNYTGKCNDIYVYLENLGQREIFNGCEMNDQGDVTILRLYPYCLEDEQLETVFSMVYDTLETLEFNRLFIDFGLDDRDDFNIAFRFGCLGIKSKFEMLNKFTNLKNLDLFGFRQLEPGTLKNLSKTIETLRFGNVELTQEMVDSISHLTNLKKLQLHQTVIGENLDFSAFKNFRNLSSLEMSISTLVKAPGNLLKYCRNLKKLVISGGKLGTNTLDSLSSMTKLEELVLDSVIFEENTKFSSLKNLKNLTTLDIYCIGNSSISFSSGLFYLTKLKKLFIGNLVDAEYYSSSPFNKSLGWSNLKSLEYIQLNNVGSTFKTEYLGEIRNLKEIHLSRNQITYIPDNIGNLKKLEVLDLSKNNLIELYPGIGKLQSLKHLLLDNNNLMSLPDEIGNLINLQELVLNSNSLKSLPETIGNLRSLNILMATYNQIEYLPSSIGNLSNLNNFNFGSNQIVELPASIGNLNVTGLNFYQNKIEKIPDEVGNMKNLIVLYLPYNRITKIPSSIGNLENLESIYLNENLIDDYLPESLNNLPKLRIINLENNINIRGKTLTNPTIRSCYYYPPSPGNTYSMCESPNAYCKDYFRSLQPCEE